MRSDQTILSEITQEIKSALPDWYGPGAELLNDEPVRIDRQFTIFIHYTVIDPNQLQIPLILKMPRDDWMTSLEEIIASSHISSFTRDEAAILQQIEQAVTASGNPNLCAIHVLTYLQNYAVTVMEQLPFQTYKQTYLKKPTVLHSQNILNTAYRQIRFAGEWLKLYHDTFSQNAEVPTEDLELMPRIDSMLEQLGQYVGKGSKALRQKFSQKHESIRTGLHPLTTLHNDFHLNNIFINQSEQVGGFDPNPGPPDSIYIDLARVITDCETQQPQVLSFGLFYSKQFVQRIKDGFLQGYAAQLNQGILDFYCAVTVLEKWIRVEQVFADSKLYRVPGMKRPLQILFQRYFIRLIETYLEIEPA